MGISLDAYRRGLHKDLGGEDWVNLIPEGARYEDWARGMADLNAQKDVERAEESRPLTELEKQVKDANEAMLDLQDLRDRYDTGSRESIGPAHPGYSLEDVAKVVDAGATVAEFFPATAGPSMAWLGARGLQKGDNTTAGIYGTLLGLGTAGKVVKHGLSGSDKAQSVGKYFGAAKKLIPFIPIAGASQIANATGLLSEAVDMPRREATPTVIKQSRSTPTRSRTRRLRTLQEDMARPYYPPNKLTNAQKELMQRRKYMNRFTGRG